MVSINRDREGTYEIIRTMGTLVGAAAEATALVEELAAGLRRIRAMGPSHCRPRVSFEECDEPMIGICWVSELIEIAGGEDVLRRRGRPARSSGSSVPKKPPRPHRTSLSGPGNNGGCCSGRHGLQPQLCFSGCPAYHLWCRRVLASQRMLELFGRVSGMARSTRTSATTATPASARKVVS